MCDYLSRISLGAVDSLMFKLSKKADYGLIAVKHLATHRNGHACSANEISEVYGSRAASAGQREHFARAKRGNDFSDERRPARAGACRTVGCIAAAGDHELGAGDRKWP